MKKLLILMMIFCAIQVSAQPQNENVLVSKTGKIILPEGGEYAVGISTNPLISFVGNMFNEKENNNFYIQSLGGTTIYGKYFASPQMAWRAKIYVNYRNDRLFESENSTYNSRIHFGYEKRHGDSRWQFLFGPEILLEAYGETYKGINVNTNQVIYRNSEDRFNMGARGFAGIEYFIFPKISLAAELGLSVIGTVWGKDSRWIGSEENKETQNISNFLIRTDHLDGQLMLMFHF
jgi:hypothetical protein